MGLILVRYGEIALKGANRPSFIKQLRSNIHACLQGRDVPHTIEMVHGRIYVHTEQVQQALEGLRTVFGVVSFSPAVAAPAEFEAICEAALAVAREAGHSPSRSFRVLASRADKTFPIISPELKRLVGDRIHKTLGGRVDLSDAADLTVGVEVRPEGARVYGQTFPGPGGLPLGTGGRAVALISGGIDSPVAAWMMMKRGCVIIPVHLSQSEVETNKALENCQQLAAWSHGWRIRPIVINQEEAFGETYRKLQRIGAERWTCIFCKRTLMAKAAELAVEHHANAIVTGENLGQVASQTLPSLEAISYGVPKPILRPLIGFDKVEITGLAQRIGTFDISTRDSAPCPYLPDRVVTTATMDEFRRVLEDLARL